MGILNVTPDSFSDGGRYLEADAAVRAALRMLDSGADLIDIGGESTRPGAEPVSADDELARVIPVLRALREATDAVLSIDTTKARVAEAAVEAGADIVNDISGGTFEPEILRVVASAGAGYVAMHTPGRPTEMNALAEYADVVTDVARALSERLGAAIDAGIATEFIALDPGFGFGKTAEQNYALLHSIDAVHALGRPVLVGVSRKRMIREVVGTEADAVEHGTTAAGAIAAVRGPTILRVHDVLAGRAAADITGAVQRASNRSR